MNTCVTSLPSLTSTLGISSASTRMQISKSNTCDEQNIKSELISYTNDGKIPMIVGEKNFPKNLYVY
jgi:hypothetical protein